MHDVRVSTIILLTVQEACQEVTAKLQLQVKHVGLGRYSEVNPAHVGKSNLQRCRSLSIDYVWLVSASDGKTIDVKPCKAEITLSAETRRRGNGATHRQREHSRCLVRPAPVEHDQLLAHIVRQ
jgi:hypothetical protein